MRNLFGVRCLIGLCFLVCGIAGAVPTIASTLRVEQDGTGDFISIQPAVNASAPGDTVLIGPGEYEEYHSILIPLWPDSTVVFVDMTVENLTLIGANPDSVIIGPDEYFESYFGPIGICGATLTESWTLEGVTVRNVRDGVYVNGHGDFYGIRFESNANSGILSISGDGLTVADCKFLGNIGQGLVVFPSSGPVIVEGCTFQDNLSNHIAGADSVLISACIFLGGVGGIQLDNSSGTIADCKFRAMENYGIAAITNSVVNVVSCDIEVPGDGIRIERSTARINGSVLDGAYRNVWLRFSSIVTANNNHIFFRGLNSVRCDGYGGDESLDFTNNYWGTDDPDTIAAGIWDVNDDPGTRVTVVFEPFAVAPLSTEQNSLGSFKAMFR